MKKWFPMDGEKYWFLGLGEAINESFDISIQRESWYGELDDNPKFNTFRTRKEALNALNKIKKILGGSGT